MSLQMLSPRSSDRSGGEGPLPAVAGSSRLLWSVFAANAVVLAAATVALAASPVTVSFPIGPVQALVLAIGLGVMLAVNLVLLRRVLAPFAEAEGVRRSLLLRTAEEEERRRLARELHDEVGQLLTVALLQVDHAGLGEPDAVGERLATVRSTLESVHASVRGLARRLRPQALDDLGLANALIALAESFRGAEPPRVSATVPVGVLDGLSPETELVIYRVAQEACTNAVRHAGAAHIQLRTDRTDTWITLSVADDGSGIHPRDATGSGMPGMRERAALAGGEVEVRSHPGAGTTVVLRVPAPMGADPYGLDGSRP